MTTETINPTPDPDCRHRIVVYYGNPGGGWGLWACEGCSLRFYPARRKCVNVGHLEVVHVDPAS